MLGAYVAPDGTVYIQVDELYKKAKAWAIKIKRSHLNQHEALVAYLQVLLPGLSYPTGAIPITEEDCTKIIGPALNALLPKLNLSATQARDLIHAPARYAGPEIPHLYR